MTSLEIFEFKETIKKYVYESENPLIVSEMVLRDILSEIQQKLNEELIMQVKERDRDEQNVY